MGIFFFKSGKDKAVKGEGWAQPFICHVQDTVGLIPTGPIWLHVNLLIACLLGCTNPDQVKDKGPSSFSHDGTRPEIAAVPDALYHIPYLTLLHSEQPKLCRVSAVLSAIGLW